MEWSPEPWLCDICKHVRDNPVGQKGSKAVLGKFVPQGPLRSQRLQSKRDGVWSASSPQGKASSTVHPSQQEEEHCKYNRAAGIKRGRADTRTGYPGYDGLESMAVKAG